VWIALPKKAALYTMNFSPEQRFRQASHPHAPLYPSLDQNP
jgi:hypothetical protein